MALKNDPKLVGGSKLNAVSSELSDGKWLNLIGAIGSPK